MENWILTILSGLFIFATSQCYSQRVSVGVNLVDIPAQIFGATVRIEPNDLLYLETFGSYRPLKARFGTSFLPIEREGIVLDFSAGIQKIWRIEGYSFSLCGGSFLQIKQLTGIIKCGGTGICTGAAPVPERLDIIIAGIRLGSTFTFGKGFYAHG